VVDYIVEHLAVMDQIATVQIVSADTGEVLL
jgi:hypothetical protein